MKKQALVISLTMTVFLSSNSVWASEEAKSNRISWLKQDIGTLDKGKPQNNLRPFVAKRHLPTERELKEHLIAQQAHLDERVLDSSSDNLSTQSLRGQIATYITKPESITKSEPISNSDDIYQLLNSFAKKKLGKAISTNNSHNKFIDPRTISARSDKPINTRSNESQFLKLDTARRTLNQVMTSKQIEQIEPEIKQQEQSHPAIQPSQIPVEAPVLTADEKALFDELLKLNKPGASSDFVDIGGTKSARAPVGPPPFPLNLLPEDSLKEFVGHKQAKIQTTPVYFGSWHGPSQANGLSQAGFHSYTQRPILQNKFSYAKPVLKRNQTQYTRSQENNLSRQDSTFGQPVENRSLVALYPPYGQ